MGQLAWTDEDTVSINSQVLQKFEKLLRGYWERENEAEVQTKFRNVFEQSIAKKLNHQISEWLFSDGECGGSSIFPVSTQRQLLWMILSFIELGK